MDKINLDSPHSMGTTIIGVTYNGGVVLGADSRTSTGVYVANRASDKITKLTDNVYICRSGSLRSLGKIHFESKPPLLVANTRVRLSTPTPLTLQFAGVVEALRHWAYNAHLVELLGLGFEYIRDSDSFIHENPSLF